MPIYIQDSRVDWGWNQRAEAEQAIIRKYQPVLDESNHGIDSFSSILARASAELPSVEINAVIEEDNRARTLLLARRGKIETVPIKDTVKRAAWKSLPWLALDYIAFIDCGASAEQLRAALAETVPDRADERANREDKVELPLEYPTEKVLRSSVELAARFMKSGHDEFVADVVYDRFLVTLAPGKGAVQPLIAWPSTESEAHLQLVRKLFAAKKSDLFPVVVPARERAVSSPGAKLEQALYLPESMLREIQQEANRTDRSLSWIVQYAWKCASKRIAAAHDRDAASKLRPPSAKGESADKRKQTLYFPGETLAEIEEAAKRFDSSNSWVVQLAYSIARPEIKALPAASDTPSKDVP